jgi:hypothetical protein
MTKTVIATALALALTASASAQAPRGVKAGTLTCDISGGIGLIVASQKQVQCLFTPSATRTPETYVGTIRKFGLDVGATAGGRMVWTVYASTTAVRAALAGSYAGATAEATAGAGVGANALVGGSNRTVTLQPLSLQGQAGLNVAAGVAQLELAPAPRRRR